MEAHRSVEVGTIAEVRKVDLWAREYALELARAVEFQPREALDVGRSDDPPQLLFQLAACELFLLAAGFIEIDVGFGRRRACPPT